MNEHKIKNYYLTLSIINLLLAVVFLLIPGELTISERVTLAIKVNVLFHIIYHMISRLFIWVYEQATKDHPNGLKFGIKFFTGFAIAIMILPLISAVFVFKSAFFEQEYQHLFSLIFLSGMVLGGYSMKIKFKAKRTAS